MRLLYSLRNINVFHYWINELFSEEHEVPRTLLEGRKTVWNCVVLWGQFIYSAYSVMKLKQFVYLACSDLKKAILFSFLASLSLLIVETDPLPENKDAVQQ